MMRLESFRRLIFLSQTGAVETDMRLRALTLAAASALVAFAPASQALAKKQKQEAATENQVSVKPASKAERGRAERLDLLSQAAFWSNEFNKDASDLEAGQKLAQVLRQIGQPDRAVEITNQALGFHPTDKTLLLTAGRALIEAGLAQQAIPALQRAAQIDPKDWRAPSAIGVALDSMGRRQDAQAAYNAALTLDPKNAAILSNLGLSTALSGDLRKAEDLLTQAAALPGADAQVRQNLSIVLAMQGKFPEAEMMARRDLPNEIAAENMAYVKSMVSSGRSWDSMKSSGGKTGAGLKTGG